MKRVFFFLLFPFFLSAADPLPLIHGQKYSDQNVTGWLMSEKLDGIRAVWDGKQLLSRRGTLLRPPAAFVRNFPPFPLDGELWSRRNDFEHIVSIVTASGPSEEWLGLTYNIFEAPESPGDFVSRMKRVRTWFDTHPAPYARIIRQRPVTSAQALQDFLKEVEAHGGEGVMVKNPAAGYRGGRSNDLLKVKDYDDMEGRVIGYREGKGRFDGMVGSLLVELDNGVRFYLGSGLTAEMRKNPPPIGSEITFKYYGWTRSGKPRFASFMRLRPRP